jgi:hypothetical protein
MTELTHASLLNFLITTKLFILYFKIIATGDFKSMNSPQHRLQAILKICFTI